MLTPAQHTRRSILKAFKRLTIEHVDNTQKDKSGCIQWLSFDAQGTRYWQQIRIYSDGTANGTFPHELFAFFCPEV